MIMVFDHILSHDRSQGHSLTDGHVHGHCLEIFGFVSLPLQLCLVSKAHLNGLVFMSFQPGPCLGERYNSLNQR